MLQKADKGIEKTVAEEEQLARVLRIWKTLLVFDDIKLAIAQRDKEGKWK